MADTSQDRPRQMPDAWIVRAPGAQPAVFTDYGRALAYSVRVAGVIGELYEHRPAPARPSEGATCN